ncbi:hypothetical protein IMT31_04125 [Citricoccus nitrophenolicus]
MRASEPAPRRRGPRRADAPGTGPASADGPEPQPAGLTSQPTGSERTAREGLAGDRPADPARLTEHERWLLEQLPPHWG